MLSKSASLHPSSSSASLSVNSSASKSKSPPVKPASVFSDDGSFLYRMRRSMKEEEEIRKEKQALERKRKFAERFKHRGKRSAPTPDPTIDTVDDKNIQDSPNKKPKLTEDTDKQEPKPQSPQAEYYKAIGSYSESLKENGTGIRPLVK